MKVGIVGYGNMGRAFAKALSSKLGADRVLIYEVSEDRKEKAVEEGFGVAKSLYFLLQDSDILLLAVKPKDLRGVLEDIKEHIGDKLVVSIVAGVEISFYEALLGENAKVVRLMPNINVQVGQGATAITSNRMVSEEELSLLEDMLENSGNLYRISEALFDSFTALAGSGPAFVFEFIDALALAGVREGFDYETALSIALDTLMGSARLLKDLGGNPNEWITRVASPGGTTIEGITFLERKGFRGTVIRCVEKTSEKARKLKG